MSPASLRLYWNTLRHLEPEQVQGQLRRRWMGLTRRSRGPRRIEAVAERPNWGWSVPRCRAPFEPQVLEGRFRFWGREKRLDLDAPWEAPELGKAWNYPVHYFDAAPTLAAEARSKADPALRQALCTWIARWITAHPPGTRWAWDAYTTALRIVNWLDVVHTLGSDAPPGWRAQVMESLYLQAAWLESEIEWHLLGTHLIKDAKALALAGAVFEGEAATRWHRQGTEILARELRRQVHRDGGHVEPSPAYHALALEDVLDVLGFEIGDAAWRDDAVRDVATRMVRFLVAVRPPHGGHPLLGDAAIDAWPTPGELLSYAERLGIGVASAPGGWTFYTDSGLAIWRDGQQFLLADVGPIGPPHLAGHGHCDSLSFEWHVAGVPMVVDSGTLTYEIGAERMASRSVRAHNTIELDGREQHEIWAAFRVARRSQVRAEAIAEGIRATLVPWHDGQLRIERRFTASDTGVRIADQVTGPGEHTITSRLHLHPRCVVTRHGSSLHLRHGTATARIQFAPQQEFTLLDTARSGSVYCASFGEPVPNPVIQMVSKQRLPVTFEFVLQAGRG